MTKWYEVKMTTVQKIMVEVIDSEGDEGEDQAYEIARDFQPFSGETEYETWLVDEEEKHRLDSYLRHADEVVYLKDYAEDA